MGVEAKDALRSRTWGVKNDSGAEHFEIAVLARNRDAAQPKPAAEKS
jgi:hypothetical protein